MNKAAMAQLSADLLRLSTVLCAASVSLSRIISTVLCAASVSQDPVKLSTVLWTASVSRSRVLWTASVSRSRASPQWR